MNEIAPTAWISPLADIEVSSRGSRLTVADDAMIDAFVKIKFTEKQPLNTWQESAPQEYGFYSNVNPSVDHPRWSQATERRIGEFLRRKTMMFNGYGDQVASLYAGMDLKKNY